MKKITHTVKQQHRRQGALDRFHYDAVKETSDSTYKARKDAELAALKTRLGV